MYLPPAERTHATVQEQVQCLTGIDARSISPPRIAEDVIETSSGLFRRIGNQQVPQVCPLLVERNPSGAGYYPFMGETRRLPNQTLDSFKAVLRRYLQQSDAPFLQERPRSIENLTPEGKTIITTTRRRIRHYEVCLTF